MINDLKIRSITVPGNPAATGDITFAGDVTQTGNTFTVGSGGAPLTDGDKGDITVSVSGSIWTIDNGVVDDNKISGVGWNKISGTPTTVSGYGITDAIDGTGAINEIPYWVDSNTLGTLAVATYPSLTELSYVKGVTSAIQTQLGNKQPLDTQLTDLAGLSYTGNALKYIRVNAGENGVELATVSGSGASTALDNLAAVAINTDLVLGTTDTAALGSATKMWSDLFLASGAVINFNNGNATLTHSATLLTSNVDIAVPDEAYGVGWDGSTEVPTKNALYDKIQTISGGSVAGSDTQIQFNDGGSMCAEAAFAYQKTKYTLTVDNIIANTGAGLDIGTPDETSPVLVNITAGSSTSVGDVVGADINISAGDGTGSFAGGTVLIAGGDGDSDAGKTGGGGAVDFIGGSGGDGGNGGGIFLTAGYGGGTSGDGGSVEISGGAAVVGNGGQLLLFGGDAGTGAAGNVYIYGGSGSTADGNIILGNPGKVLIQKIGTGFEATLDVEYLTEDRTVKFPDSSGQISLTGQILAQLAGMANL